MLRRRQPTAALVDEARSAFEAEFGSPPRWSVVAPGRVNLIGDHTDYSGGLAMPFAIELGTVICAEPRDDNRQCIEAISSVAGKGAPIEINASVVANHDDWTCYLRGVTQGFREAGVTVEPMNLYCHSSLPTGTGLSSSAALEVACGRLLEVAADVEHDPDRLVQMCVRAEHEYAGVPCGSLDQFSVTNAQAGHVMLFDSGALSAQQIPFASADAEFLIVDSKVKHALGESQYPERRRECAAAIDALGCDLAMTTMDAVEEKLEQASPTLFRRAKHIVSENVRVRRMAAALADGNLNGAGSLMYESHRSLAEDYEVSCRETDLIVSLLQSVKDGLVFGARMTGGGFGGAIIALIRTGAAERIAATIAPGYARATGIDIECATVSPQQGVKIYEGNDPHA